MIIIPHGDLDPFPDLFPLAMREITGRTKGPQGDLDQFLRPFLHVKREIRSLAKGLEMGKVEGLLLMRIMCTAGLIVRGKTLGASHDLVLALDPTGTYYVLFPYVTFILYIGSS